MIQLAFFVFAGITVAAVLVIAALMGQAILDLFGIRLAAFSVAGGILFLILAVEMIRGEGASQFHKLSKRSEQLPAAAIVPLGVPLMAGPGAISTVILASPGSANWFETTILISSIAVLGLVTWLCFSYAQHIGKLIGDIGIQLISRIMGLILAALAIEYMVKGIQILFNL